MGRRWRATVLVALSAVALAGCGRRVSPVRGVLTLDGAPVDGATVLFMPDGEGKGRPASGFTSAGGMFRLTTFDADDGALPGTYRVVVQKTAAAKDRNEVEQAAMERAKAKFEGRTLQKRQKLPVPGQYAQFDTTPLRCTVPVAGAVNLELHRAGK